MVGSGRAGVAPVVCGLVVRASPERLSILLTADTVSSAAGPGAAGKVTGGRSGGAGKKPWVGAPLQPRLGGTGAAAPIPDPASWFPNASRTTAAASPEYFFDTKAE